ncbi:hypothetical protein [Photobacterium marinum]|uniref:hypothetical protein n=1 Tax=Photobacterium marinum TaxID=1056511 RepID=UPI0005682FCB|nr:hypothetical protein [Photobacterium marinum]
MNLLIANQSIKEQMENWITAVIKEYELNGEVRKHDRCNMISNGISLLMRCQTNDIDELCLVIATVRLDKSLQSQGWFKSFLSYCIDINPWDIVAIEDVDNPRLREFCKKNGFAPISKFFATSFIVNQQFMKTLAVKEFNS